MVGQWMKWKASGEVEELAVASGQKIINRCPPKKMTTQKIVFRQNEHQKHDTACDYTATVPAVVSTYCQTALAQTAPGLGLLSGMRAVN